MADRVDKTKRFSKEKRELEEHKSRFVVAFNSEKKWRENKKQWQRFYDGDQLSHEEKDALEKRGQPEVVINRIKPKVDGIIGIHLQTKVTMKAYDRGSGDFEKAKFISEALRYIDQQNHFEDEEAEAAEEAFIQGRSWYEHEISYCDLEVEFKNKYVPNDDVVLDPYCRRADLSDAKEVFKTVWVDLEDAIELFPDYEDELEASVDEKSSFSKALGPDALREDREDGYKAGDQDNPDLWFDKKRKRVRLVTRYYRVPVKQEFALHEDIGLTDITNYTAKERRDLLKTIPDVTFIPNLKYRLNAATYCAHCLLEKKEDIRPWDDEAKFPLVMVPAFVSRDDEKMPYGIVKQMIDPQKEINKRRSKMLHILSTTQVVAEKGAVDEPEKARIEIARPDGWVTVNPQMRFEINRDTNLAASQFQLLQEAKQEIDEAGVSKEVQGNVASSQSGRAIALREQVVVRPLRKLFKNLRFARKRLAILNLEDIQHYWREEKLIKITDDPSAGAIVLNQKVVNPETGEEMLVNDVSLGKYDVVIEEAPDTIHLQSEQFDTMAQLASNGIPIPADMLIEASSLPNKQKILQRLQEQQQMMAMQAQAMAAQGQPPVQ